MKPKFTKEYLEADGFCPYCNSVNISSGHVDRDVGIARSDCICIDCHEEWRDEYKLDTISWIEPSNDEFGTRVYSNEE